MKFNDKEYEYYSWSIIDIPFEELKYYKDIQQQIIENSKFYTKEFGYYYDSIYKELENFLNNQSTFIPIHFPEYIFLYSKFIKGIWVLKIKNNVK